MSAPLERQYVLRVGKGGWGPTLAQRTPTSRLAGQTVEDTNINYQRCGWLGVGLLFSRGGLMTYRTQTGASEKTLWAVPLYTSKCVRHSVGEPFADVRERLRVLPWVRPGEQLMLRWGETYSLQYEDPTVTGDLVHVKADLWREDGEDPEAPDSPPAFGPHGGDPLNFYGARGGTRARLAAMLDVLRAGK